MTHNSRGIFWESNAKAPDVFEKKMLRVLFKNWTERRPHHLLRTEETNPTGWLTNFSIEQLQKQFLSLAFKGDGVYRHGFESLTCRCKRNLLLSKVECQEILSSVNILVPLLESRFANFLCAASTNIFKNAPLCGFTFSRHFAQYLINYYSVFSVPTFLYSYIP